LATAPATPLQRITLLPAASISGRLTGKPAAGIAVVATSMADDMHNEYAEAVTDSAGRYRISQLQGGNYTVVLGLTHEQAATMTALAHTDVQVDKATNRDGIDFSLIDGCLITGKIADRLTRKGLPDVLVSVESPANPEISATSGSRQDVVTDAEGIYRVRVPAGPAHVYLMMSPPAPGYKYTGESYTGEVKEGAKKTINFALTRE